MSDENDVRYPEDDPMMPEPLRYIFQLLKRQEERGATFEAETQRKIDALLDQQAQLSASLGKVSDKLDRTADGITSLLAIAEIHDREIIELAESVKAVDERGRNTDERLNALIGVVERLISDRQNGKG